MPDRRTIRWMKVRLLCVVAVLVGCAGFLLVRIWSLQVSQSGWLRELSEEQYLKEILLEPMRGPVLDRNGTPLAVSVMTDSIFVMPQEVAEPKQTAVQLARALGLPEERLVRELVTRKHFTWIQRRLAPKDAERARALNLAGVHFTQESRRYYPARELAGAVVGFAGDGRGLEGLELKFDGQLRGSTVMAQGLRDAKGNLLLADAVGTSESIRGGGVVLTLDGTIQEIVERELEQALKKFKAKDAIAVVMDPRTGEILAMANAPSFNPNTYAKFPRERYRNRAATDCYEPGSTLKVFSMAAALQERAIRIDESVEGSPLVIGHNVIHNSDSKDYDRLSPKEVLVKSNNGGMARIGLKLGREKLHQGLRRFGFGRKTGIDFPGESACVLRPPKSWSEVGLANIAFGHGVSVTVLQLTAAVAALANDGVWMRPLLVREIRGPKGELLQRFEPEPGGRVIEEKWRTILVDMMAAVTEPGGTGRLAAVEGFRVAGKTGTAQKVDPIAGGYSPDKRIASFVGFVPAEAPRIVLAVVVDEPETEKYGGLVAAPVFSRIAEATLRYLGVFPDGSQTVMAGLGAWIPAAVAVPPAEPAEPQAAGSPREEKGAEKARPDRSRIMLPDLRGLSIREALRQVGSLGLDVLVTGSGRVTHQSPPPGQRLGRPDVVQLVLESCDGRPCKPQAGTELAVTRVGAAGDAKNRVESWKKK